MKNYGLGPMLGLSVAMLLATACSPRTFTKEGFSYRPYSEKEFKQEKDGIITELRTVDSTPPAFTASVQACARSGQPGFDEKGNAVYEQINLALPNQMWNQVAITNNTEHVIRFNQVAVRLKDPSGNSYEPLTREDLEASLLNSRPCSTTQNAAGQYRMTKLIDRNMEIVPGSTSSGWVAFVPANKKMTGTWKFAIYDVPTKVDDTGKPTKVTKFDIRTTAIKAITTYRQEHFFAPAVAIETKEIKE